MPSIICILWLCTKVFFDLPVCEFEGENATRGHYVTNVYYPNEDKWKNFNDTVIRKVTEEEVLGNKKDSYVLFYVHEKCWPKAKF